MNTATIKTRWMGKLARAKSFVIVTDTESVIFSEHTEASRFDDYITANMQLAALKRFQAALNVVVRDFDKDMTKQYGKPKEAKKNKNARKITVQSK